MIKLSSKIIGPTLTNIIGNIAFYKAGGPLGSAYWSYNFTRAMGGSSSQAFKAGAIAAVSAEAFNQIGRAFDGTGGAFWKTGGIGHVATHALTGGIISELQGGKFGHGFWSAGLTKGLNINGIVGTQQGAGWDAVRIAVAAVVGGTVSKVTGGKFSNGATTAAFAQAFNGNEQAKRVEAQKKRYKLYLVARKSALFNGEGVGHAFIGGISPGGTKEAWGFWPGSEDAYESFVYGAGEGVVKSDLEEFNKALDGNGNYQLLELSVDQGQYEQAIYTMASFNTPNIDYGLLSVNCTSAAVYSIIQSGAVGSGVKYWGSFIPDDLYMRIALGN
ncbi:hypothetical protein [Pseudoalteromonas sp. PPB1]|uniref:hypothetical protein n=1 Tax=Pseudoalteromonas sp. PPB1 TaxID=2756136 RepID=UPI001E2B2E5E|nr:hypothetical protein [Pseudoalteromonas sp. PPB1]